MFTIPLIVSTTVYIMNDIIRTSEIFDNFSAQQHERVKANAEGILPLFWEKFLK